MKSRRCTVAQQGVVALWRGHQVEQARPIFMLEDRRNLLEAIVDLPASVFAPYSRIAMADNAIGAILIPGQEESLALEVG